jgi:peptide/nickel transport system substrate-binding protein
MNDCSFRQAVAVLIDKEYVTQTILQGVAFPLYTYVPEANAFWFYDEVPMLGQGLGRGERIALAVQILQNAGYTWEDDLMPTWNEDGGHVDPGAGLIMPDGVPVPPLDLYGPAASYDPLRATFAVWIETWMREAGIPVTAHMAGFNVIVPIIFTEQAFDMYILGWSLGVFPSYLRDFFSEEQAVVDGNNAGGYISPEFEELSANMLTCTTQEQCLEVANSIQLLLSTETPYVVLFDTGILEPYAPANIDFPYTEHLSGLQYVHQTGGPMQSYVTIR